MNTAPIKRRVAIIGCGAISASHIIGIISCGQTICALCDIIQEKARALSEKYSLSAHIYTDYITMLDTEKPDSVHICTPHFLHAEMIMSSLARGINVLCEKPVCITEKELFSLREAVKNSRAMLGVCLQNRWRRNILELKKISLEHGICAGAAYTIWNRDEEYYKSGVWRGTKSTEGGGVAINQAIHTLDLLEWICGMPEYVTADISNNHLKGVIEVEDTASALFECTDGKRLNFFATTSSGADFPAGLLVRTEDKTFYRADDDLLFAGDNIIRFGKDESAIGKSVWGNAHKALISDFYRCLHEQTPFPIGLEEGAKSVRMVLGMYKSRGNRIRIPD